jgi:asparagine synthase (glutamine-hydrolysing)
MARELDATGQHGKVNSVSACYDEQSVDERPFMEAVVERTRCIPHWCYPRFEDAFALSERITWHQDEPYGSTSIFAQWCVFEEARRAGLKVMLDGQGADEQLAGYHGCFPHYYADLIRRRQFATLLHAVLERRAWHGVSLAEQIRSLFVLLAPARWVHWLRRERLAVAHHDWLAGDGLRPYLGSSAFEIARESIGRPAVRGIGDLCVILTHSANLAMLLHWEDRNSMAHGIEARVPFLDHRVVEFAIGLGDRHKIVGGDTKRVLRRAMSGILPEKIGQRRDKLGFTTPEETWFRGPLREAVLGGVEQTLERYPGLLNPRGVRAHVADMIEGRRPVDFSIWRIISLGIWGRVFAVSA